MVTTAERALNDLGFAVQWLPQSDGTKILAIRGKWSFGYFVSELIAGVHESSVDQQVVAEIFAQAKYENNVITFPTVLKVD